MSSKSLETNEPVEGKNISLQASLVSYSSSTGSDSSESSISKTVLQDNHTYCNHIKNSDAAKKSNSCESLSSNSDELNSPNNSIKSHKKETADASKKSDSFEFLSSYSDEINCPNNGIKSNKKGSVDASKKSDSCESLSSNSDEINCPNNSIKSNEKGSVDASKKSDSCESLSSNSNEISCLNNSIKSHEKESVLKSKENELNESSAIPLTENPKSSVGNVLKTFATPTSVRKSGMLGKSTPLKRSFSMTEDDDNNETTSFTAQTRINKKEENLNSWPSPEPNRYFSRKSLPAKARTDFHTSRNGAHDKHLHHRRSFPFSNSPHHSPATKRNFSSYRTDQTPYSPGQNAVHQHKRRRFNLPYYDAFGLMSLESESGFIDSHCHLDFIFQRQNYEGTYAEYQKEHKETFPKSYRGCLAIFCNPFTFSRREMWVKFLEEDNVWASFGCHPHNAKDYNDDVEKSLYAALEHSKVRALGEIGLDYSNRNSCMKSAQFEAFRRQLRIALEKKLPLVIHCREAHEDAMGIMKEILPVNYTIHLHCFTDTWDWAQKWLNEFPNLCIGITNVVTFPSAESVHEVATNIPLNRLLLETDAPYFIPKRGCQGMRWSHPGLAIHVAAQIAALKSIPIEEVFKSTRNNTKRVYNI